MTDRTDLPTVITKPSTDSASFTGGLLTASAPESAYTTITRSVVVDETSAGATARTTQLIITVTDAAEYSSYATQSAALSTISSTASASASASATTSSAAAGSSAATKPASNLSILIPAIVAPVVTIFVITFILFWWFMRRRAQQAAREEPEFVMEKRSEKFTGRDDSSTHSHSSTRKLVTKAESIPVTKEPTPSVRDVETPSFDLFPADRRNSTGLGIGVAKPTEPSSWHSRQNSNESHNPSGPPLVSSVAVRNFSRGPSRPNTASRDGEGGSTQFSRDGAPISPGLRPATTGNDSRGRPPPARGPSPNLNRPGPRGPPPPFSNNVSRPNSPATRGAPSPVPRSSPRPPPSIFPSSKDRPQYQPPRRPQPPPAPIRTERQTSPKVLSPPTPTGAYNGASPISQFSPIVKDGPGFNTSPIARELPPGQSRKEPPSAIKTKNSPIPSQSSDYSEENMHIARLADSSRLGFYPTKSPPAATYSTNSSTPTTVDPPNPSPRLPPPATRDAPPSNINIPIPPTPVEATMPSDSRRADSFAHDRRSTRSMVSRLSSDDEYIDAEVDTKSEVSSLDDGERWQMEQDSRSGSQMGSGSGSTGATGMVGYGGLGAGPIRPPPSLMHAQGRSPDSEASSSAYSLGKY